ncbi:MAG: hypothetical protein Q3965_05055 [Rothia sp. (in: high G+C Gram-positive bacteria)]|nr:hypothetical protein [Rothia sp. (in: high G+C Gram-positive bacteria)]
MLSSLCLLAWLLWRILRKGMAVIEVIEDWEQMITSQLGEAATAHPLSRPHTPALFTPVPVAVNNFVEGKNQRTLDRTARRIKRRDELGQPQLIGDLLSSSTER